MAAKKFENELAALDDPEPYLRGLRHIQMEPVWGGQADSAGPLRAQCALALVACRRLSDHQVLGHLTEITFDADKTVRAESLRAIGRIERPEAALLLRMRCLAGDREPEVIGTGLSALLAIEGTGGLEFAARFLERPDDVAAEAAVAIGSLRVPESFALLRKRLESQLTPPELASVVLASIALTRQEEAIDYLLRLVRENGRRAEAALTALIEGGFSSGVMERVKDAVAETGNARLRARLK